MKRLIFLALSATALSGCTGTHLRKPAVCDGKHRRPANLYGSILPSLPVPLPASQGGGQSGSEGGAEKPNDASAKPVAEPMSDRALARSYSNC